MVYVRLAKPWTDANGTAYAAGAEVDVDAATLAKLEAEGIVWIGPDGTNPVTNTAGQAAS